MTDKTHQFDDESDEQPLLDENGTQQLIDPGSGLVVYTSPVPDRLRVILPDQSEQVFDNISPYLIVGRKTVTGSKAIDIDMTPFDKGVYGVSRVHARILPDSTGLVIQDLKSTNGTEINGRALQPSQSYPLHSGDTVKFGNLKVQFVFEFKNR